MRPEKLNYEMHKAEDMNNYQEIDIDDLDGKWDEYKEMFLKLYPDHAHLVAFDAPSLINLIHYS